MPTGSTSSSIHNVSPHLHFECGSGAEVGGHLFEREVIPRQTGGDGGGTGRDSLCKQWGPGAVWGSASG